jgi:diguanylate cyclase (GGDEF)-like protein
MDINTMMILSAFITVMSGGLLIFVRFQYRDSGPILWWAAAHFINGIGTIVLAASGQPPQGIAAAAAFTLLVVAASLAWSGARRLCSQRASLWLIFGPAAMIVPATLIIPLPALATAGMSASVLSTAYMFAAAWSFAFGTREKLLSRWPLSVLCFLHAGAISLTAFLQLPPDLIPFWLKFDFQIINFEGPLFVLGTSVFVVAWARERSELRHKMAADTDVLTGLASRRAFLASAERVLERCRLSGTPCAVLVFDLDHFKTINDTFGHHVGDRVLETFGIVINRTLRPQDIIGRLGGEEFAALAAGSDIAVGVVLADRVRRAFSEVAQTIDDLAINGTLSAGVSAYAVDDDLSMLLRRADSALYRAKLRGRNRVEAIGDDEPAASTNVVRVA